MSQDIYRDVVYMDNNATTKVAPEVFEAMIPYLTDRYGNSSSMHDFGGSTGKAIEYARKQVANMLGAAEPTEIIFTSCGTESDNTAINAAILANPEKKHLITSTVEHPAILEYMRFLERKGYEVTYVNVNKEGLIDVNEVLDAVREDTALVTIMWANNETGVLSPIEELAPLLKEKGVLFHSDAVQAVGKVPIDVSKVPVDMLSISGHKFHAPKGIGALYIKKGTIFKPFIYGGHQERGRRGGTYATPNIVAMGKAAELAVKNLEIEQTYVRKLRDKLETEIKNRIKAIELIGHREKRLPNTSNISFAYIEGEAILLLLSELGIAASSGSACSSGSLEPSHVLRAMGFPFEVCHASIRFSLSHYNTEEDVNKVLVALSPIINKLRRISPFTPGELRG